MDNFNLMEIEESIDYILNLCKNKILSNEEKENTKKIFNNKIINPNYNNGYFLIASSINGNFDMINILKEYNCEIHINDNEPLRICAQNNYLDCALLLFDETIDINEYDYSSSYDNLRKIKNSFNNKINHIKV